MFNEENLSLKIGGRVESRNIRASVRSLIGNHYVNEILKDKYKTDSNKVYIEARRKAIKKTDKFIGNVANILDCYGNLVNKRGEQNDKCLNLEV